MVHDMWRLTTVETQTSVRCSGTVTLSGHRTRREHPLSGAVELFLTMHRLQRMLRCVVIHQTIPDSSDYSQRCESSRALSGTPDQRVGAALPDTANGLSRE